MNISTRLPLSSCFNFVALSFLAGLSSLAVAKSSYHSSSSFHSIESTQEYFSNAGVFDDADRKTGEEYATAHATTEEVIKTRFAASGDILCGGMMGQAQVVIRRDVILTAAHTIYETGTCKLRANLNSCKLRYEVRGRTKSVALKEVIKGGYKCPRDPSEEIDITKDIVEVRLAGSVDKAVMPYAINTKEMIPSQAVTAVGKSLDFKIKDIQGKTVFPRHYGDCQIKDSWGEPTSFIMGTNCDVSGYNSGGGIFTYQDVKEYAFEPPELLGISQGSSETAEQKHSTSGHSDNIRPYNSEFWQSTYIPITGPMLDSLKLLKPEPGTGPGVSL